MSGKITVLTVRQQDSEYQPIKVDRTSVLGNPFIMRGEHMRNKVCDEYQEYFDRVIQDKGQPLHREVTRIYKLVKSGQNVRLQCLCAPRRCHADTIKAFI